MAKDNPSGPLNTLALSAVDLCTLLLRSGVKHLTPSAIGKWVQDGCPRNPDKTFSLPAVLAWHVNDRAERPHRPPAETDAMEKAKLADLLEADAGRRQARLPHLNAGSRRLMPWRRSCVTRSKRRGW